VNRRENRVKRCESGARRELEELVRSAEADDLRCLVLRLAGTHPEIGEECCSFLAPRVPTKEEAAARAVFSLWDELEADLEELDARGGGDEEQEDRVAGLLVEVAGKLKEGLVPREDRRALLDEVMPYIASANSGMEDDLYHVAYAACYDDEDLRDLAERLVALNQLWPRDHARRIYRRIGDREKYLALRALDMKYGSDYYDLATFYWESGERDRAIQVAREGLENGQGRLDELRQFLAQRALEAGDRAEYLELQFAQATGPLTEESYRAFRKLCSDAEWEVYEPRVLAALERLHPEQRLPIHLLREEYDLAVGILAGMRYPREGYHGYFALRAAEQLETRYPDQVLAFYMTGLGPLGLTASRKEYARNAQVALRLRHMWVDVLRQPEKWRAFAKKVKEENQHRPAFQEEFARVIPDWKDI